MQAYNKAIAAVVVPAILAVLHLVGITADMRVDEVVQYGVGAVVTAVSVYLIPNRK